MAAGGKSPCPDMIAIEVILGGVRSEPSDDRLAVFNLSGKRSHVARSKVDAGDRVTILHQPHCRGVLLPAVKPGAAIKPDDYRERAVAILRSIEIKPKRVAVNC